jgi:hypothetical protein
MQHAWEMRNGYKFFVGIIERKRPPDGRIVLKWILQE